MKKRKIYRIVCFVAVMSVAMTYLSCGDDDIHGGKRPIARAFDTYLYYEDLGDIVPKGATEIDSTMIIKQYIHLWINHILMKKKAELYLKPEQKDVQRQLDEYRDNLLIYRYKDEFVRENLDTDVTYAQSMEYYKRNPDDFILNTPAVRCIFVQMIDDAEEVYTVRRLLDFHSEKDSLALDEICREKATKYETFDNRWESLAQATKFMPTLVSDKENALRAHGTIRVNEGQYVYFLKIRDYRSVGDVMPYEMAAPSISMILINKRKTEIINKLEQILYDNAMQHHNVEYISLDKLKN